MYSRFSAAVRFSEPPLGTRFRALGDQPCAPTPQSWLRIPGVDRQHLGVFVQGAGFILLNPDANQLTRDIMPLGKRVQALPGYELLRDLPLERDAVGTLPGHGFHPLKAQLTCQITSLDLSGPRGALQPLGPLCQLSPGPDIGRQSQSTCRAHARCLE